MPPHGDERQQTVATLERILSTVVRPARYTGGEWNSIVKEWPVRLRIALAYPDVYEEAICDPWMQTIYAVLNAEEDLVCERAYLPWPDMDKAMCAAGLALYTLESKHALTDFDILLVALPGERYLPCTLTLLDLAAIPLHRSQRQAQGNRHWPFIVGAGPGAANPAPMADFFDAFLIGDIDSSLVREAVAALRLPQTPRPIGMWLAGSSAPIRARQFSALPPLPTRPIVPFVESRRERGVVELSHAPAFPWAGLPRIEHTADDILAAVESLLRSTGYDYIQLCGPHTELADIVARLSTRYGGTHIHISLDAPISSPQAVDLADRLPRITRGTLSFDLDADSNDAILESVRLAFRRGWHVLHLHTSVGAPDEPLDTSERVVATARRARDIGRAEIDGRAQIHVIATPVIPRCFGPLQGKTVLVGQEWDKRVEILDGGVRGPGLRLQWRGLETRLADAALARGDHRLSAVIETAWRAGMRRPDDTHNPSAWQAAFAAAGLNLEAEATADHLR